MISLFNLVKTASKTGFNAISGKWYVGSAIPNIGRDLNDKADDYHYCTLQNNSREKST